MATTPFGVNDSVTAKVWAKKLYSDTIAHCYFDQFASEGDDSAFQVKTDLSKQAGDRIRVTLRGNLEQDGIASDGQVSGNEESLQFFTDDISIDSLDFATKSPNRGTISQQRVPFDIRGQHKNAHVDHWAERLDKIVFNHLAGNTIEADVRYVGHNATIAASAGRIIRGGAVANDSLLTSSSQAFTLNLLDKAVTLMKQRDSNGNFRVRPIRVPGYKKPLWLCFVHPNQLYQMRSDASTAGNFFDLYKAALQGGLYPDNPIFSGAEFLYNNVLVHESELLPRSNHSSAYIANTRRAVVCGAQALTVAYGQGFEGGSMKWVEELTNYEKQFGVDSHLIFGVKKNQFNSKDFSTMVISTYAPEPT